MSGRVYCEGCGQEWRATDDPWGVTAQWLDLIDHDGGWSIQKALERRGERYQTPVPCGCGSRWARRG